MDNYGIIFPIIMTGGDISMGPFETDENQVEKIEGMTVEYPYCLHQRNLTDIIIPWHWHEELELGYIQEGTSKIVTISSEYTVNQGDGFFINSNVMDMKQNGNPGSRTLEINHIFHAVFLSGHFKSRFETKYINPIINNRQLEVHVIRRGRPAADQILKNLYRMKELNAVADSEFQIRNILSETWLLLIEDIRSYYQANPHAGTEHEDRFRRMLSYIHCHYSEKLLLSQIAGAASISEREATRCFQKNIGQSPMEYLIAYRLNQAKRLLAESDMTITEIGYLCGFADSAYFGRTFRKMCGMPPSSYRKLNHDSN